MSKMLIFVLESNKVHIIDNSDELSAFDADTTRGHLYQGVFYFYNSRCESTPRVIEDVKQAMPTLEDVFTPLEYRCGLGSDAIKLHYICNAIYN